MKSKISIQNVAVTKQCIDVTYTYTSGLQSYFHIENNVFRTEYSIPLQGLPESVAVIPFYCEYSSYNMAYRCYFGSTTTRSFFLSKY